MFPRELKGIVLIDAENKQNECTYNYSNAECVIAFTTKRELLPRHIDEQHVKIIEVKGPPLRDSVDIYMHIWIMEHLEKLKKFEQVTILSSDKIFQTFAFHIERECKLKINIIADDIEYEEPTYTTEEIMTLFNNL